MREWYGGVADIEEACPLATIEGIRDELAKINERLQASAEQAQNQFDDAEWADNLSLGDLAIVESIKAYAEGTDAGAS